MDAVARARTLDHGRHVKYLAGLDESGYIVSPRSLVEVDCQKPTGLVLQQGVDSRYMSPEEMVEDDLIRNGQESLMRALTTLDSRLVAYATNPFVGAGGCVPGRAFSLVYPLFREHVDSTAKQLAEECDFFAGFSWSSCCL
jgi:hypothetical protein